jgi:FtsP/CotA-like multicopper oxidase with cupredoxin domain
MATTDITIHASIPMPFNIGSGNPPVTNAETFDGAIPRQPILLDVGDTLIVRLINDLPYPTGIHWHGIELENYADGTEVTQSEVPGAPLQVLGNGVPAGGTFLYKFKVPKPGIFWFHPHHHHSTNRVFRGQYGMLVVSEPAAETALAAVLPTKTHRLALSDITVCKAPGSNDAATYVDPSTINPLSDRPEWLSGVTAQSGPTPVQLCEAPTALDHMGMPVGVAGPAFLSGEIPNTFDMMAGLSVEGQTVLTNGVNVGGRKGTPTAPQALDPGYLSITAHPGDGLRFQIANTASTRYFRLILTTAAGVQIDLIKVGGEGGILNDAVLEGGMLGTYNTKYFPGEILLPPGSRADVVAVIPLATNITTCTMWTRDFQRVGPVNPGNWSQLPTVPVLHIDIDNDPLVVLFPFAPGTALKSGLVPTPPLGPPTNPNPFLDPGTFVPVKAGAPSAAITTQEIRLTAGGGSNGINGVPGSFDLMPYTTNPHIGSTRYAKAGDILQFRVRNESNAHHPFHLHGFSFHPATLETNAGVLLFTWPANATEYRDNFDIPPAHTVTFKVHISPRELADGLTPGGAFGRWFFHCHIFFHAHHGMISELVITDPNGTGSEKPNVNVNGSWAYAPSGGIARREGTYFHPDGDAITLTSSLGPAPTDLGGGNWEWVAPGLPDQTNYVYITATDSSGRKDQAVFRLKVGSPDDGSDNGDPHIHTVDGKSYDFQAAGEFILLRDRDGLEVQTRQTPVLTASPITDPHSGLTSCVSLNTAVAARVGCHRIAYQPGPERGQLQFYLDGKPARLTAEGIDLEGHRVSAFDAGGATGLRVDYAHDAVLTVAPHFWTSHGLWYMNVSISHTQGDEGIMGSIREDSWLPTLPSGATVGPKPQSLHQRYIALYRTFANAWRLTDKTSLFVYAPGTSTATFTDEDWPAEKPPCKLKPQFQIPGVQTPVNIGVEKAERVCRGVTIDDLHRDCVFDVATTGDEVFAQGYLLAQDLRLHGSTVQIVGDKGRTRRGETLTITATVSPMSKGRPKPTGCVIFLVDGVAAGPPVELDERGQAPFKTSELAAGEHKIRAAYDSGGGKYSYHSSSSPTLLHIVGRRDDLQDPREDQLMDHEIDVPSGEGKKTTRVTVDVKTARRILAFVNKANRPEDLMRRPEVLTHLHVEYRKPAFPERHPTEHDERRHHHDIADEKLATEILKRRNVNPVYGFLRFADLLDLDRILELLALWWYFFSRASKGEWTGPFNVPAGTFDRPVHAALLRTGKVLFFGLPTGKDSWLWTPNAAAAGTAAATASKPGDSLFCSGHAFLSDGRLLVAGGGGDGTGPRHNHGWIFDPTPGVESWTRTAGDGTPGNGDMAYYRWYPTLVTMGDEPGRVLIVSGDDTSGNDVRQMEMYMESSDRFERVWGPAGVGDTSAEHSFPQIYPSMHLLPGGEVFYTPTGWHSGGCSGAADFPAAKPSGFYEFLSTSVPVKATWTDIGTQDAAADATIDRVKGMAVLLVQPGYPFVQAMVVGGGKDPESATTFQMINLSTLVPKWGPPVTLPDGLSRVNVNLVALPDGTIFVSGGRPLAGTPLNGGACWIYNPVTMTWQECDAIANKRGYHSVALLLPDGRVACAGNECPADDSYEVFSPPYLFASDGTLASRPVITSLPPQVHHGLEITIQTPSPSTIAKVMLVRPMAVTHQTDSQQRVVQLQFLVTGPTEVTATAPNGWHPHGTAPRGWYMVFLVDQQGVPSVGQFMHLH